MSFLTGLGGLAGGAAQGLNQGGQFAQRAQQIAAAQLALNQEKQKLLADPAVANYLSSMQGGQTQPQAGPAGLAGMSQQPMQPPPTGQPMAPGQPSVPSQPGSPPQAQPAPSPAPGGGGSLPPQAAPQGQPQQQGGQPGIDHMAGVKIAMNIAKEIKAANPGISPETLFQATQKVIDMSKGLDPMLRQQAQVVVQQMRDATSQANTGARVAATERGQDISASNTDKRVAAAERGQDIGLQKTREQGQQALQRAQLIQGQINQRFTSGQGDKIQMAAQKQRAAEITAELTSATRQLSILKDATGQPLPDTDPRVQQAQKKIAAAEAKLNILEKAVGPAGGQTSPGGDGALTATDAKGNKVVYQNGQWVPTQAAQGSAGK